MTEIERDGGKRRKSRRGESADPSLEGSALPESADQLAVPETADGLSVPETAEGLAIPEAEPAFGDEDSEDRPLPGVAVGEIDGGDLSAGLEIDSFEAEAELESSEVGAEMLVASVEEDEVESSATAPEEAGTTDASETDDVGEGAVEFIEHDRVLSLIESMLFVSDRPVSMAGFKQLFKGTNVRGRDIARALELLASEYASSSRGVSLEEIHGGYQLRTKVDNADFLRRLAKTRPFRLSGPALEALAIVAYKQPIVKAEVDQLRGVESGHLLRALMERGLVSFAGKSDLPGKPMQYGTTRKFLEIFGLRNLKELPTLAEIDDLIPEGIGADEPEEKPVLADITRTMAQEVGASYSDGEEELVKITDQLQAIDTSSEFFEQEKVRQREARDRERAQNIREALEVGEAVEEKDRRWLERYEAKALEAAAAEAALAAGLTVPASEATDAKVGTESDSESIAAAKPV